MGSGHNRLSYMKDLIGNGIEIVLNDKGKCPIS